MMAGTVDADFCRGLALNEQFNFCHGLNCLTLQNSILKFNAHWSTLQNILDRTVDIPFSSGVTSEGMYVIVYVCLMLLNNLFTNLLIEKDTILHAPTNYRW